MKELHVFKLNLKLNWIEFSIFNKIFNFLERILNQFEINFESILNRFGKNLKSSLKVLFADS